MWELIFKAANYLALVCWLVLIVLPRRPVGLSAILFLGVGLLCLTYTVAIVALVGGIVDPVGPVETMVDFTTIDGVRSIFTSQGGVTIGWVHYLAFDLFVGLWIARDADAKGFSRWLQAPILLATFLAGPVGLMIWLAVRERSARQKGWKRGPKPRL